MVRRVLDAVHYDSKESKFESAGPYILSWEDQSVQDITTNTLTLTTTQVRTQYFNGTHFIHWIWTEYQNSKPIFFTRWKYIVIPRLSRLPLAVSIVCVIFTPQYFHSLHAKSVRPAKVEMFREKVEQIDIMFEQTTLGLCYCNGKIKKYMSADPLHPYPLNSFLNVNYTDYT